MSDQQPLPEIEALWNYADPAGSEQIFRRVLLALEQANSQLTVDYQVELRTQIARCQVLQRQFDAGQATLDDVATRLSAATPVGQVRHLLEEGRLRNDQGQPAEAARRFSTALELAQGANCDVLAVDAAHMLGLLPPWEAAVEWNRRGIKLAAASRNARVRRWIGTLYLNLGVNHQRLTQYELAAASFQAALAFYDQTNNAPRVRLARLCLTKNQRLQGDPAGALPLNQELLAELQDANAERLARLGKPAVAPPASNEGGEGVGYAYEEIAECLLALGQTAAARPVFGQAYVALSADPWYPPTESERLQRMKGLSEGTAD